MNANLGADADREHFLYTHAVETMVSSNRFRRNFYSVLTEVGFDTGNLIMHVLDEEGYLSIVGDGKKVLAALPKVHAMKSDIVDMQAHNLLIDSPRSLRGLHNALARMLSKLYDAADGFHGFFANPFHNEAFAWLTRGWNELEFFESNYAIVREVLRDLLDESTYRRFFENIENLGIL
jgi:hypothetical protein